MKNLENYGVQEMNKKEVQMINGGIWARVVGAIASLVFWHWDNWDDIKEGFYSAQQ